MYNTVVRLALAGIGTIDNSTTVSIANKLQTITTNYYLLLQFATSNKQQATSNKQQATRIHCLW